MDPSLLIGLGSHLYGPAADAAPDNVVTPGHGWGEPAVPGGEAADAEDFRAAI
jgi:hypothetical protein